MDEESEKLHPAIRGLKAVCRCNNVKYRTIEKAIREGACTLAQIASRTTATTGHCGGSCTPDILQMIAEHAPAYAQRPTPPTNAQQNEWWVRKK